MDAYTIQKLLAFGFAEQAGEYTYIRGIADGQMTVAVTVTPDGAVASAITDNASGEEYVLHRVPSAEGAFVGRVRTEHDARLHEIDLEANEMLEIIIPRLTAERGIDENMKARDILRWVAEMNNIKANAEEIVLREVVLV